MSKSATLLKPSKVSFVICKDEPITLPSGFRVEMTDLSAWIDAVNKKFRDLEETTDRMAFNIFEIIDFRMLSGLIGETLVSTISANSVNFQRNPNIDGYPDILDVSRKEFMSDYDIWSHSDPVKFIKYPHGGIEVKNTFGTKKSGVDLMPGEMRLGKINNKLDWKAHHKYTNNLLALLSDFVDGCPQIVAALYSDELTEMDWADKQNPKEGSTMTSFSVIKSTGYEKLQNGLRLCVNDPKYLSFFNITI